MDRFKDIEEALAAQAKAQIETLKANDHKGDALAYADEYDDVGGYMINDIAQNVVKLNIADSQGNAELQKKACINVLNYVLFYMVNRDLL